MAHEEKCDCMRCMESKGLFYGLEPVGMYILTSRRIDRPLHGRRHRSNETAIGSLGALFRLAKYTRVDWVRQEIRRADWSKVGTPTRPARLP
jgi:hypothetical protein